MSLTNKGYKVYEFSNGDKVNATFNKEIYSGVFMGSLRSEATDTIYFTDKHNDLKAEISFGKIKKKYPRIYVDPATTSRAQSNTRERRSAKLTVPIAGTSTSTRSATGTAVS